MAAPKPIETNYLETKSPQSDQEGMFVPSHGKGLLRNGGKKGDPGGPGVAPSVVRDRARQSFYDRINQLERITDAAGYECEECGHVKKGRKVHDRDVIKAIDTLGRYGLMTGKLDIQEVQQRLQRTIAIIEQTLDPDAASRLLKAIDPVWNPTR